MINRLTIYAAVILAVCVNSQSNADPLVPPNGYQFTNISSGLPTPQTEYLNQLIFKAGDPNHLYASTSYHRSVVRYNFNAATGQLSNPFTVLSLDGVPDQLSSITGIGFHGEDLWISRWPGWVFLGPSSISRVRDTNGDGVYEDLTDFAAGIELGIHTINQIQISGDSLYVGIGDQTNTGNPSVEQVYNGTIARIADLNHPVLIDLATTTGRDTYVAPAVSDGQLRRYAKGFRNPYGLRISADGKIQASDNGGEIQGTFPDTPDFLYQDIRQDDVGHFPPAGQPGAPEPTMTPITLATHAGVTGFDVIRTGPQRGNTILAYSGTNPSGGNRLAMLDAMTGEVSTFMSGFNLAIDVVNDPFGRLLISEFDGNVSMLTPPKDADPNLDGVVDIRDLFVMALHWHTSADWYNGDFDRSGFVDAKDLGLLAINWQNGASALSAALTSMGLPTEPVPEPTGTLVLSLIGGLAISRRRRMKHTTNNHR